MDEIVNYIVDAGTGEVVNGMFPGDRITRGSSVDYLANTIEIGKDRDFVKMFTDSLAPLADEKLTGAQLLLILVISKYIRYGSGLVAFDNGKSISADQLADLSGISRRTVYRAIDDLATKRIIFKGKTGNEVQYYFNPFIFAKGKRVNKTLYAMFKKSKWRRNFENEE